MAISDFVEFFAIGLATPLTAACVLPLYPAYLSYLASTGGRTRSPTQLAGLVVGGVIVGMATIGVVFGVLLGVGIGSAVQTVSPVAFGILLLIGMVMLVAPHGFGRLPTIEPPHTRYPTLSAFGYGVFFAGIVIPCNPALVSLFIVRATTFGDGIVSNVSSFVAFGLGIGAPLLVLGGVSEGAGQRMTRALARYSGPINRATGIVLIGVSAYYLVWVFGLTPLV